MIRLKKGKQKEKQWKDLIYYMLLFFVLFVPRERIELPSLRLQFSALPLSYPGYIIYLIILLYLFIINLYNKANNYAYKKVLSYNLYTSNPQKN